MDFYTTCSGTWLKFLQDEQGNFMIVCPSIFINRFLHDVQWNLIVVLTRWAGGARGINESGTNEDTHCLPVIWRKDAFFTYLQHQHGHGDQTMFGWGLSWFSCFKLLDCNCKGTSPFMTSAHDALVFVQVCNLWWVSDTVPQGRGDVSVQLLSRITPDYPNRMSNLHF